MFSPCWVLDEKLSPGDTEQASENVQAGDALSSSSDDGSTAEEVCSAGPDEDGTTNEGCATPAEKQQDFKGSGSETAESETVKPSEKRKERERGWGAGARGMEGVDAETLLGNTVVVSVASGPRDLMVHPSQCVAEGLGMEGQSVSVTTEAIEGCGFGVDHAALVWCKQLVSR